MGPWQGNITETFLEKERKKEMARSVKQPAMPLGYVSFGYVIQF
jgi:hypothetical protein